MSGDVDHPMTVKDREAVRALMDRLPELIAITEAVGCAEAKHYLELAQQESRRLMIEAGGTYDH